MGKGEGHVLFAVMGGIFSEGVDLPGNALEAASCHWTIPAPVYLGG